MSIQTFYLIFDWVVCLFVWYWVVWAVCLFFDINLLLPISFANIFSQSIGCLFVLSLVSFALQKLLYLIRSHLFIFVSISFAIGHRSKKTLLWVMSKSVLPMFSSRSFMVSSLAFRSLIYFEFSFVCGVSKCCHCFMCALLFLLTFFPIFLVFLNCVQFFLCVWDLIFNGTLTLMVYNFVIEKIILDWKFGWLLSFMNLAVQISPQVSKVLSQHFFT